MLINLRGAAAATAIRHARGSSRSFKSSVIAQVAAKSIIYERNGEPSQIIRGHQWDLPELKSGQIRLKVGLASINPADINVLQGVYPAKPSKRSLPGLSKEVYIGGNEGYGIVEEVAGSCSLKSGDWVVFGKPQMGTWSSHIICEEKDVVKITRKDNESLTPIMASTLQVNPATAYRMLTDFQTINKGDVIIQNAANSAVGQAVIQIASRKLQAETINLVRNRPDLDSLRSTLSDLSSKNAPAHIFTYEELANRESGVKEKIKILLNGRKIKLGLNSLCGIDNSNMAKLMGSGSTIVTYGAMSKQPFSIPAGLLIFQDFTVKGFMMNQWYAKNSSQDRIKLMNNLVEWYEEGSLQTPTAKIVEFSQEESVDDITKKAREAVEKSMGGFGGQKMFFKFL